MSQRMNPCHLKPLPVRPLGWECFVDLLGKAHAALACFAILTKAQKTKWFQKRELLAQVP
jgi:hypothetical protein